MRRRIANSRTETRIGGRKGGKVVLSVPNSNFTWSLVVLRGLLARSDPSTVAPNTNRQLNRCLPRHLPGLLTVEAVLTVEAEQLLGYIGRHAMTYRG